MGSLRYIGAVGALAQSGTITVSGYDIATAYRITTGGSQVISTIGAASLNATATALADAINASTLPEISGPDGFSASATNNIITLTATTPGTPFSATSSVSGGAGT